ncbi:MAG: hypothetical protein IKH86_07985 [Prevotella sp.]|nr:hypothetical protein [Prevotella sp.]
MANIVKNIESSPRKRIFFIYAGTFSNTYNKKAKKHNTAPRYISTTRFITVCCGTAAATHLSPPFFYPFVFFPSILTFVKIQRREFTVNQRLFRKPLREILVEKHTIVSQKTLPLQQKNEH